MDTVVNQGSQRYYVQVAYDMASQEEQIYNPSISRHPG